MMANPETQSDDGQQFMGREPAWRMFAAEFNEARHETSDGGERSPTYVVSPLGARVSRVLVVGVLTSNEAVGEDGSVRRAQVTDPTGVFHIYAGQYQPEALQALTELEPPAIVAVVGKARTYSPSEGVVYTSIRPEVIHPVESQERDAWILQAAQHTLDRVEAVAEAAGLEEPNEAQLIDLGVNARLARGIVEARTAYGAPDLGNHLALVADALGYLLPNPPKPRILQSGAAAVASSEPAASTAEAEDTGAAGACAATTELAGPGDASDADDGPSFTSADKAGSPGKTAPEGAADTTDGAAESDTTGGGADAASDAPEIDAEGVVLDLVEELDEGEGAPWDELVSRGGDAGLTEEDVEEAMNLLMDRGRVFEPVLGRLKVT